MGRAKTMTQAPAPISAKHLFFAHDCFTSPIAHDSFPEVTTANAGAFYNPIIDAMFLPGPQHLPPLAAKREGAIDTYGRLELGHRLLNTTSIMCQLRHFAGLLYFCIFQVAAVDNTKPLRSMEKTFLSSIRNYQRILEIYMHHARPLHEVFALLYACDQLAAMPKNIQSDVYNPEEIKKRSLARFPPEYRSLFYDLERISERFCRISPLVTGVLGSLNIPWPSAFAEGWTRDRIAPDTVVDYIQGFFRNPANRPTSRFKFYVDCIDAMPSVGVSLLPEEDLVDLISRSCPSLISYFTSNCLYSKCNCDFLAQVRMRYCEMAQIQFDSDPVLASLFLSRHLHYDSDLERLSIELGAVRMVDHNTWQAEVGRALEMPCMIFVENRFVVKTEAEYMAIVGALASYESIRQQIFLPQTLQKKLGLPLKCPWNLLETNADLSNLSTLDPESQFNKELFRCLWSNLREFRCSRDWRAP